MVRHPMGSVVVWVSLMFTHLFLQWFLILNLMMALRVNILKPPVKLKICKKDVDKFLKVGKKKYFQTKIVLRGRSFHPDFLSMDIVKQVCELLRFQGWEELFLEPNLIYEQEVVDFYTNLIILEGDVVSSSVKRVEIVFDATKLGEILHISSVGINDYHWAFDEHSSLPAKFFQGRVNSRA